MSDDLPYGIGVFMIMWELPRAARPRMTEGVVKNILLENFRPDED